MSVCMSAGVWYEKKLDDVVEIECKQCGRRVGRYSRVKGKTDSRGNRRLCEWM